MFFCFGNALLEISEQLSQRINECIENMCGIVYIEVVAFLQHSCVNLYYLLLHQPHVSHCHKVQHVLAVQIDCRIHLSRIEQIQTIHRGTDYV